VPTARLELAQLSPLPPQDSVSTNFTTSAKRSILTGFGKPIQCKFDSSLSLRRAYFGISFA